MNDVMPVDAHGKLIEAATLKIQRVLPGPIDRIWRYLTDGNLRRQWLAAGEMELRIGSALELVWRNDELSDQPTTRPEGFAAEMRMASRVTELDPPRRLAIAWGNSGDVSFDLETRGSNVLLTVIHRRLPDRDMLLKVSAGWHAHLDLLVEVANGRKTAPFWESWGRLHREYDQRL
ncbi:MAG: SRPBCC family protein [Ferrovibrionaceae bacterium]